MNVRRPFLAPKTESACSMRSMSLASPTRRTFHRYREESGGDVLREGEARLPFDRDVVVVVNPAQRLSRPR